MTYSDGICDLIAKLRSTNDEIIKEIMENEENYHTEGFDENFFDLEEDRVELFSALNKWLEELEDKIIKKFKNYDFQHFNIESEDEEENEMNECDEESHER